MYIKPYGFVLYMRVCLYVGYSGDINAAIAAKAAGFKPHEGTDCSNRLNGPIGFIAVLKIMVGHLTKIGVCPSMINFKWT